MYHYGFQWSANSLHYENDLWIYILYYLQSEGFIILLSCIYWKDISFVLGVCDSLGINKLFLPQKYAINIYIYKYIYMMCEMAIYLIEA